MLLKIVSDFILNKKIRVNIIVINSQKNLDADFKEVGATVFYLRENLYNIRTWMQILTRCLRSQVIVGWMYHGNVLAFILSRLSFKSFIQNIRQSLSTYEHQTTRSLLIMKIDGLLSYFSRKVIFNSSLSMKQHLTTLSYRRSISAVIPNGFKIPTIEFNKAKGEYRKKLNLSDDELIIFHAARYHPDKDHETLLQAAVTFINSTPDLHVRFVLAGTGVTLENGNLKNLIPDNLNKYFLFLGERNDLEQIFPCADIFTLSSKAEAFPNVLGEAMSYGVYPVSTDVGDAAKIISNYGELVPVASPKSLVQAWKNYLLIDKETLDKKSKEMRKSIQSRFDLSEIANQYLNAFLGED